MKLFAKVVYGRRSWTHCVKSVQIRSYFWSVFSCIRTEYGDLRSKKLHLMYLTGSWITPLLWAFFEAWKICIAFQDFSSYFNSFQVNVPFLYFVQTSKKRVLMFRWGYRKRTLVKYFNISNSLTCTYYFVLITLSMKLK